MSVGDPHVYVNAAPLYYYFPMAVCVFVALYGAWSIHAKTEDHSFFTLPEVAGIIAVAFLPVLNIFGMLWLLLYRIHPDNRRKYGTDNDDN